MYNYLVFWAAITNMAVLGLEHCILGKVTGVQNEAYMQTGFA